MNRLEAMSLFVRVAELQSFTAAALSLGLPKSSASQAVSQLEAHLKVQLLYRTTRRVQLTHDGQAYYERCREVLAELDELDSMFSQTSDLTGALRVDMPVSLARNFLVPRLPEFMNRHPGLEIELSCTDRRVDVVAEGFDCVIRVGALADSALMTRPLGFMHMGNYASPAYLARHGEPKTLDDLKDHHLIHYALTLGSKPFGFEYRDGDEYRVVDMPGRITVNNTEAFSAAALAGLGILQSPRTGNRHHMAEGRLVEILPQYEAEPLPVSLVYPRRRHQARRVRAFMDWVSEIMRDYLD
ncbi:LysR family transcriptional regulator [Asticcacaulis taihuensis]|uniref:DNA-binding transcriptional regulator, LysR family n=1 Tax=Asticcacaulis taihuensis TaxID=260084 RepID=A0A1G4RGX1_9CAUL|nr:LysR family transcriptional regulator [Asticcacaulis taihuensis]SCW56058.1 DNA-binding transcriptional regulator, LysR family [Asticcacaulis taihuensis]